MKPAVIYARVSSKEQADEGFSIPAQSKLLREYAADKGFSVKQEFVDVETAKQAGRAAFGEMVGFLRRNHKTCRTVLVEKTDRLYRNLRDYVTLDELDLEIHFAKEGFVLSDESRSAEKFMHGIKVLMAKNYVDNLSEEASKGMREKAAQGVWPSSAPIGYMNVQDGDRRGIAPDPVTAPLVRKVFEWYATGHCSFAEAAERVGAEGLTTRFGKVPCKSTIERILKNPFYIGTFTWGGRAYQGTHEPLVTVDLFQRAQQALGKTNHPVQEKKRTFAYTGLITCAHCGCSVTAEIHKGKYVYYHCTGSKGGCAKPLIREDRLEDLLGEVVKRVQINDGDIEWIVSALKASHQDEKAYHEEQVSKLQAEVRRLQERMDAAYEDKLDGTIGEETWRRKSHEWRSRQLEMQAAIERHLEASQVYYEAGVKLLRLAQNAYTLWLTQPQTEKRQLLNLLQSNLSFDGVSLTA
ncbi:MAG: recombinase family protein, partial [Armatimonadetes bacterium]|nr:recombinase family protein [Armatimonadota bacterium]